MKITDLPPFCFSEKKSLAGKAAGINGAGYDGMYILQSAREQCQAGWLVDWLIG